MRNIFKFRALLVAAVLVAGFAAGCQSRRLATQSNQQFVPPPPPQAVYPGGPMPYPQPGAQPGAFPTAPYPPGPPGPSGAPQYPQPPSTAPFPTAPSAPGGPPMVPPSSSSAPNPGPDRVGYRWEPAAPSPSAPVTPPAPPSPPSVLLLPPSPDSDSKQTPRISEERKPTETKEPAPATQLPVSISGFGFGPRDNFAFGFRPSLEGLDWLEKQGYQKVIFLHLPNEATDADRQQVEKRKMTFIPIEINPRDLNRDSIERFRRLQTENRDKTFVYDLDASLAGPMWYLSFRLVDQDTDETARIRARSLGMAEDREAARETWQAVRKYLEQR